MRPLTMEEKEIYGKLTEQAKQLEMDVDRLLNRPVIYGYARVSSKGQAKDGNSLDNQEKVLTEAGCEIIYQDVYTGTTTDRPELDKLISILKSGDTLVVTKLDRLARSVQQGIGLIDELADKDITIRVMNMGVIDNTPTGKLIRNVMLSFAEFERDMIMQRTREGKEQARLNPDYREGRKKTYSEAQISHALELLNTHSYTQVSNMTGISKSTLIRARKNME